MGIEGGKSNNGVLLILSIAAVLASLTFIIMNITSTLDKAAEGQANLLGQYLENVHEDLNKHRSESRTKKELRLTQAKILRGDGRTLLHRNRGVDFRLSDNGQVHRESSKTETSRSEEIKFAIMRLKEQIFEGKRYDFSKSYSTQSSKRFIPVWKLSDLKPDVYKKFSEKYKTEDRDIVFVIDYIKRPHDGNLGSVGLRFGSVGENGEVRHIGTGDVPGTDIPVKPDHKPAIVDLPYDSTVGWGISADDKETLESLDSETLMDAAAVGAAIGDLTEDERGALSVESGEATDSVPVVEDVQFSVPADDLRPIVECDAELDPTCDDSLMFHMFGGEESLV